MSLKMMTMCVLSTLSSATAMYCSSACEACCPKGPKGEWLTPTENGDCADASDVIVCRLTTGKCLHGMGVNQCDEVPLARIEMDEVMEGELLDNTFLADGMIGWNSEHPEGHSALHNIPAYYHGFAALIPHQRLLGAETEVRFVCPAGASGDCDAVVFLYECFPCASEKGGIPSQLAVEGFERSNCGPTFTTGKKDGRDHPMTSWRKAVKPGQQISVTTKGSAEWVAFAMGHGERMQCSGLTQGGCEDIALHGFCQWNGASSTCETNTCGPPAQCASSTDCASKDFEDVTGLW